MFWQYGDHNPTTRNNEYRDVCKRREMSNKWRRSFLRFFFFKTDIHFRRFFTNTAKVIIFFIKCYNLLCFLTDDAKFTAFVKKCWKCHEICDVCQNLRRFLTNVTKFLTFKSNDAKFYDTPKQMTRLGTYHDVFKKQRTINVAKSYFFTNVVNFVSFVKKNVASFTTFVRKRRKWVYFLNFFF